MSVIFNNPVLAVVALILGFGFLIFVHELGHFAVAKFVGIRATQFAIGFGNAVVSYRKGMGLSLGGTEKQYNTKAIEALQADGVSLDGLDEYKYTQLIMEKADALGLGETEYRLNWIPLGGYVKMLGQEDMDPTAQSDDPNAFNRKSIGARAAVISAGVVMNLIFALIFFIICFQMGVQFPAAVVGGTVTDSPAARTYAQGHDGDRNYQGLRPGDRITHLDGKPITDMAEVRIATALGKGGQAVAMTVDRDGQANPLIFDITAEPSEANEGLLSAGIMPSSTLVVGENADPEHEGEASVTRGSAFDGVGIQKDMILTAVNGQAVENYGQFIRALEKLQNPQVQMRFASPDGGTHIDVSARATPQLTASKIDEKPVLNFLGLKPATLITEAVEGKPADKAGVNDNDILAHLGSVRWPSVNDVSAVIEAAGGDELDLAVWRDGKRIELGKVKPRRGLIGIGLRSAFESNVVAGVVPGSLFDRAAGDRPLPAGSRLVAVMGKPVADWAGFQQAVQAIVSKAAPQADVEANAQAAVLSLTFEINLGEMKQETYDVPLSAAEVASLQSQIAWLPPAGIGFEPLLITLKADGPVDATMVGLDKTGQFIQQTYITLLRIFQGTIGVKNLRGPVGIVDQGAKVAKQGMAYYLFFLGIISINLAVLNFLPLPIVDGGLMVFLMIEKLKGSPASPKIQMGAALVGVVCLASIFLYVTFNDIYRIIG